MSDSLKERLRSEYHDYDCHALRIEALARIEELEAENERLRGIKDALTDSLNQSIEARRVIREESEAEIERLRSELNHLGQPFGDPAKS